MPVEKSSGNIVERDGVRYLDVDAAAAYLGKGASTIWLYLKRYEWPTYRFPLHGKRTFIRQADLDGLRNAPPQERPPKDEAA